MIKNENLEFRLLNFFLLFLKFCFVIYFFYLGNRLFLIFKFMNHIFSVCILFQNSLRKRFKVNAKKITTMTENFRYLNSTFRIGKGCFIFRILFRCVYLGLLPPIEPKFVVTFSWAFFLSFAFLPSSVIAYTK